MEYDQGIIQLSFALCSWPLVGHASDGDSRRRKLILENSTSKLDERYKINHENFSHSGLLVDIACKKFVQDLFNLGPRREKSYS